MKNLIKSLAFIFILGLVASCAKDELEQPSSQATPSAVRIQNSTAVDVLSEDTNTAQPAEVNDDGDDETGPSTNNNTKK